MSVRLRKRRSGKTGRLQETWLVDVDFELPDGRRERIRKVSPVQTRRGAEEYERQLRGSLLNGSFGKEAKKVPTYAEFVPQFWTYVENNNKPSTQSAKKQALTRHLVPYFGRMKLDDIGPAEIERFKAEMRKKLSGSRPRKEAPTKWAIKKRYGTGPKVMSPKTINNTLSILRKSLSVAVDWGVIDHMPKVKLFKVDKPPFDFLSFEEAERLVAAADPEWSTVILTALKSGLRIGELIGLQWSDVDLVTRRLTVRRTIWHGHIGTPKGGRSRTVDLPASVVAALKSHRRPGFTYVFSQADGSPLNEGMLKMPLERALRRSGISRPEGRIGWHDLRHTYGSHLAMKGVPLKAIQELLGHATIEMTMRYAHLSPETKQEAVKVLDEPYQPANLRHPDGTTGGQGN